VEGIRRGGEKSLGVDFGVGCLLENRYMLPVMHNKTIADTPYQVGLKGKYEWTPMPRQKEMRVPRKTWDLLMVLSIHFFPFRPKWRNPFF
jgi:hypothetical protein